MIFNDDLIIYKSKYKNNKNDITHGDSLIKFIKSLGYENDIYYYEAVNEDGKIKTENLTNALEWMKHNKIKRVNISLSSKHKSEKWINKNIDKQYKSNKIILINYGKSEFFEGNSYLSIYTMLNE